MADINEILNCIKYECFIHNGLSFDYQYQSFSWVIEKNDLSCLFGISSLIPKRDREEMKKYEQILKQLPKGISYTKQHKLVSNGYYDYETQYIIHIPEVYSRGIVNSAGKGRTFIKNELESGILEQIYDFKSKVQSQYQNIVKDMYIAFEQNNDYISSNGIGTNYDGYFDVKVAFSTYGLKSLIDKYQILGLAYAIAEYGAPYLQETEYFCLELFSRNRVRIYKIGTKSYNPDDDLSEW